MEKFLPTSLSKGRSKNKKRVVVAMSGGVDSSVAAALLKKQGYDVVGVFMRFWQETRTSADFTRTDADENEFNSPHPSLKIREGVNPPQPSFKKEGENINSCCSEGAEQAARAVAAKLDIPFYVWHFEKEFKKAVVDYFLKEQKRGRTPNPCVVCNKKIKFGIMFEKALSVGADYIATGHYARVKKVKSQKSKVKSSSQNLKVSYKLYKAEDRNKDQSYFLYTLTQKQLGRVLFPLGDYRKEEVYKLAKKWRLPFRQGESFDLCFVARDTGSFLKKYLKLKSGKIVRFTNPPQPSFKKGGSSSLLQREGRRDLDFLGYHQGLALYTIGQRKNIPVNRGPWWVVKKDERKNILYVSNNEKDLYTRELVASKMNWLNGQPPELPMKIWVKIRYKSEVSEAVISKQITDNSKQLKMVFRFPQRAVTPGQSVVFYSKDGEVLGGGVILK